MFLNIDVDSDFSDCISFKFYFKHQILFKNRPIFRAIRMRPCAGRAFIVETCLSSSQQRDRGQRMFPALLPEAVTIVSDRVSDQRNEIGCVRPSVRSHFIF